VGLHVTFVGIKDEQNRYFRKVRSVQSTGNLLQLPDDVFTLCSRN
jgi:hypothetical protein